ncbi:MAG: 50S ribosomal protein L4 [Chitinophagaceae bacterium]|nr:50S ribosomal protein L4 [Chitinophagaceae bacterium]
MNINIKKYTGEDTGRIIELPDNIFQIKPNDHVIYLDVKQYLANQRQGTHKTKERAEVSRSTRKIKKQKGTGGARAGSLKSPLFKGGGTIFGPKPRDYHFKLNKKEKILARKSALSYKATENKIQVVENFDLETPKTREFLKIIQNLDIIDKKVLFILDKQNNNIYLSSRNIKQSQVILLPYINTYQILNADNIIFLEKSIQNIQNILK